MISRTILLCYLIISCFGINAQNTNDINGIWTGYLTQNEGGLKQRYNVRFELTDKNGVISGNCIIDENELNSKMDIAGFWKSKNEVIIRDLRLLDHKEPKDIDWCMKQYIMKFKKDKKAIIIEGTWSGETKNDKCIPGKIYLSRAKTRA